MLRSKFQEVNLSICFS
uniref:Uncharacterized protein n=1 Tax=Rhizophora mucronata TaxID=61149 RepID=A0A2P2PYI7_RHIMU